MEGQTDNHIIHRIKIRWCIITIARLVIVTIIITRPRPAFGRLGLGGSSGGYSSHGYTSHAPLRAYGAQLGGERLFFKRLTKDGEDLLLG